MADRFLKHLSRRDFLKLAGMATTGAVLAACGTATPDASPPDDAGSSSDPEETATEAPELESIELSYHFLAWGAMEDVNLVAEAMSEITQAEINASVELVPYDWGGFNEKLQLALAAKEPIDMMFTCNWANSFYDNVKNGTLLPLDDLLPTYAPGYWSSIKQEVWEAARVGDDLYGAINEQIWATVNGFNFRKDLLEKYNWDVEDLGSFEEVEAYFEVIKENEPDMYPTGWFNENESPTMWGGYWGLDGIAPATAIRVKEDAPDPFLRDTSDEYRQACEIARRWYEAGYMPPEPTTSEDFQAQMKAGKYSVVPVNAAKPGREGEDKAKYGWDFVSVPMTPIVRPWISTSTVIPTMNGITYTCKNPERTAMLMEMLNTHVELYNLICKGIEGKHWVWVDKAKKLIGFPEGLDASNNPYNPNTDWMFGNQFNAYYVDESQADADVWEETRKLNENALVSPAMGFAFDQTPVETQIAQVSSASEYGQPLAQGLIDTDEYLEQHIQLIKDAGGDEIVAEVKRQFDAWRS
jgi:putative aldouronate transport system substrate-binding protein